MIAVFVSAIAGSRNDVLRLLISSPPLAGIQLDLGPGEGAERQCGDLCEFAAVGTVTSLGCHTLHYDGDFFP
ncbi:hypothetical protein M2432_001622 [Mycobacterium sp. OTB74]|nr:hypothetical protein [Mycobacterium sp. OTB74]